MRHNKLFFILNPFMILGIFIILSQVCFSQSKLYVTSTGNRNIYKANLDGTDLQQLINTGDSYPVGIGLDILASKLYFTINGSNSPGMIQRADLDGNNIENLLSLPNPSFTNVLAMDVPGGKMYWTNIRSRKIQRANTDGSNVEDLISSELFVNEGITVDGTNEKIYFGNNDNNTFLGKIEKADKNGGNREDVVVTGVGSPSGVALDLVEGKIYWGTFSPSVYSIATDPITAGILYSGTISGGVLKSADGGATWASVNNGLTNANVYTVAIDPLTPGTLYVGTYGSGVFKSTDGGNSWLAANTGLLSLYLRSLVIDPLTSSTLYAGTFGGGVFKSTDSGNSWTAANNGLTSFNVSSLVIDPLTSSTLYAGTSGGGVFKSTDNGNNWIAINNGLSNLVVVTLAIDPDTPNTLYAGTTLGGIFKSTDGGNSWTNTNFITNTTIYTLTIDNSSNIFAGTFGGVFRSTNGGTTWSIVNIDFNGLFILSLTNDPITPGIIYAGARSGEVFKSTDYGITWIAPTIYKIKRANLDGSNVEGLVAGLNTPLWYRT